MAKKKALKKKKAKSRCKKAARRKKRLTKEDKLKRLRVATLRKRLTEVVLKKTAAFKKKFYGKKVKLSKRAKDIAEVFRNNDFGCYELKVRSLVEAIVQEPIFIEDVEFKQGVAVVPLKNKNKHGFTCRKVCLFYRNDNAIKQNGYSGWLNTRQKDFFRPATEREIVAFISDLPKSTIAWRFKEIL